MAEAPPEHSDPALPSLSSPPAPPQTTGSRDPFHPLHPDLPLADRHLASAPPSSHPSLASIAATTSNPPLPPQDHLLYPSRLRQQPLPSSGRLLPPSTSIVAHTTDHSPPPPSKTHANLIHRWRSTSLASPPPRVGPASTTNSLLGAHLTTSTLPANSHNRAGLPLLHPYLTPHSGQPAPPPQPSPPSPPTCRPTPLHWAQTQHPLNRRRDPTSTSSSSNTSASSHNYSNYLHLPHNSATKVHPVATSHFELLRFAPSPSEVLPPSRR